MKKFLLLLFLLFWQLHAIDRQSTLKIYHEVFASLTHKKHFSVFTKDEEIIEVFSHSPKIRLAYSPETADIILVTHKNILNSVSKKTCQNKIIFATQYRLMKDCNSVVGAFYWRRGRAQLLFIKNRLKKHGITLPVKYKKYMRDNL